MSVRGRWGLIILGVVAYLVGLVVTLPAARAYPWLAPLTAGTPVQIGVRGLSGTVWDGAAEQLSLDGVRVGRLEWALAPAALLTGRVAVDWSARQGDGYLTGRTAVSPWGAVQFSRIEGRLPVGELARFMPPVPVALEGLLSVRLDSVRLRSGQVADARGVVAWQGAEVIAPRPLRLGDLKLDLQPAPEGGVQGVLSDGGGPLLAEGDLHLSPEGTYRFQGRLASRDAQQPALAESLAVLGPKSPKGGVRVSLSGRL